uniref:Aminopeptidase n=1 Tax=Scleropages formosus TaxID=113540 RepID=A0A8C9SC67_SCLFO
MSRGARRVSKTAARAAVTAAVLALLLAAIAVIAVHQGKWKRDPPEGRPVVVTAVLSEAPPNMRLPKSLIPDRYRVYLQVHLDSKASNVTRETFTFSGNSTVKFKCTEATAWIYIHCKDLNVTFLRAMDEKQSTVEVKNVTVKKDESNFLEIELRDTLRANETYYLITAFSGPLVHDSAGLYIIEYRENEGSQRYLATSHMQPTDARKVFPCFDEPHMKAVFEVTIIHRKDTIALTNAAQKAQAEINIEDEAWLITEFFPTQHMSTYLLAFTVFNYEAKMTDYGRYTWGPPEAIVAGHADYAHRISGQILKFFEDHYDMKYPLPKLGQSFCNAMENWGLVMYNKKAILYEEGVSTTTEKENIAAVIAHELAHQWFGNLVTMKWWNDLWLNEAFATYYSYLGVDGVEPAWNFKDLIISNEVQYMLQFESLDSSRPIIKEEDEVQSPEDIAEQFDIITYKKATNDSNKNIQVAEMMESWTKQEGYPVITINTSSGEVSQRHFLLNQSAEQNLTWHVPIKVMKSGLREVKLDLMQYSPLTVSKPTYKSREEEWILANVNSTGYYRVNYDLENWRRLVMQLETQHQEIPVISRGQLIDDAFNLAVARQINFTLALDTTKFLRKETEFIPWNSAIKSFQYLKHLLDFTEVSSPMKVGFIKENYQDVYYWRVSLSSCCFCRYNQINAVTLACSNDVTKCHKMATDAFNKLEKNPDSEWIHPNLKRRIYCTAIAAGGEKEWDFAWEMFQNTKSMTEKKDLLSALACTKQTSLLKRYLEYSLDPDKIKKSDFFSIIQFIATNADGQQLAWDFIQSKWEYIIQTYEEEEVPVIDLIHGVTQRFSSEAKLEELRQFLKNQGEEAIPSVVWALESAIESTQFNIQWVQENKQNFLDWFHRESVAH